MRIASAPTLNLARMASLTSGPPLRVLVVDDDVDGAEAMAMVMQLAGHEVAVAHDGEQAVKQALRLASELVLLDLTLAGGIDGYEVARRLRNASGSARPSLVAVTGSGRPQDRQRAREAGFELFLTKPVEPALLRDVAQVVQSRRGSWE
jgi:CheY-like chemotaxis protein